ncbi:hypothetical protein HMPREF9081_1122 [Centipeda periodontii DSM 2778]|uniref:Uncharacterized protein n=1 Tax=Centipeda periodontii DSM 2778 TaxID=888060 RepID=F5RLI6_9FIRM|nr:hypothetical protein [Centipeda periodontii]EGK60109.1 hypothetical protein HMPREF9081_1122 [Centipeda periodontii DSM 2778]
MTGLLHETNVGATALTLDGNRFQNATNTPTTWAADVHAGILTYGNTTNHNKLNVNMGLTIYEELKKNYSWDTGRHAISPILLFKPANKKSSP